MISCRLFNNQSLLMCLLFSEFEYIEGYYWKNIWDRLIIWLFNCPHPCWNLYSYCTYWNNYCCIVRTNYSNFLLSLPRKIHLMLWTIILSLRYFCYYRTYEKYHWTTEVPQTGLTKYSLYKGSSVRDNWHRVLHSLSYIDSLC